jgi:hypothetical protein
VGGGIASDGTLTIRNSAITQNTAGFFGGGIYNAEALAIKDSTITRNTAGNRWRRDLYRSRWRRHPTEGQELDRGRQHTERRRPLTT